MRTAFIGNENFFDRKICEWLSARTDLSLIIWMNKLTWGYSGDGMRKKRVSGRFLKRAKKFGKVRALNELLYYAIYRHTIARGEVAKVKEAVQNLNCTPIKPLSEIRQVRPDDIRSEELQLLVEELQLDAMFAMCIDVYLPNALINAPRHGTYLWHEGITPDYRGVYSPFWALVNNEHDKLGYTLLRMNSRLDAGEVFVQGRVNGIDPLKDWHSFIGHKAVLDSLPEVEKFLQNLARGDHQPIDKTGAVDGYYSYPTATSLIQLAVRRRLAARRRL